MTHWLANVNRKIVANDSLHVGCFECTGMLLKLNPGPDDEKVKLQGSRSFLTPFILKWKHSLLLFQLRGRAKAVSIRT
jgi:hypothetical protein